MKYFSTYSRIHKTKIEFIIHFNIKIIATMNIFFLDLDPNKCAKMHVDKHAVKMILESTQILCSVHHMIISDYIPVYKLIHKNHPCNKWARESLSNYIWLCKLAKALCAEYTYRYGKIHKCEEYINQLSQNLPTIEDKGFTPPAKAMPDNYKEHDVIYSYRNYYFYAKKHIHKWKKRSPLEWLDEYLDLC